MTAAKSENSPKYATGQHNFLQKLLFLKKKLQWRNICSLLLRNNGSKSISKSKINYPNIEIVKADNGYKSNINSLIKDLLSIEVQCGKSNFGTSEFIPIQGRWVVERTISWLDSFRRLARNYEQFLHTAQIMAELACVMLLLKYI